MSKKQKPIPVRIVHDGPSTGEAPRRERDTLRMSIRQIENGFIVNKSGHKGGSYFDTEYFTPHVDIPGSPSKSGRAPARGVRGVTGKTKL